jgi:hypothetical protein
MLYNLVTVKMISQVVQIIQVYRVARLGQFLNIDSDYYLRRVVNGNLREN